MTRTSTIKRAITAFGLAVALAAVVVSSAFASAGNFYYGSAPGAQAEAASTLSQCPCNGDLSVAAVHSNPTQTVRTGVIAHTPNTGASTTQKGSPDTKAASTLSQCPCNSGLPVASGSTGTAAEGSSFNWGAAGGAGVGLALLALAVGILAVRARNDSRLSRDWNSTKRRRLARWLERAAVPERPVVGRGPRYIVRPSVTLACAPSLRAIAAALRDETIVVDASQLRALQAFVSGSDSPLHGDDPTAALREVVRLQHSIVGTEAATLTHEQETVATSDELPHAADPVVAQRGQLSVPA